MDNNKIDLLLKNRVSWLADSGPEDDIAISSRIRLARNVEGLKFPINCDKNELRHIMNAIFEATKKAPEFRGALEMDLEKLTDWDRQILLERRLISRELMNDSIGAGLAVTQSESLALMINEEDHLRLQYMLPGFQLTQVWNELDSVDNTLSSELPFTYSQELGFLTSCPTNVGTGMRASVMLHLPGLVLEEQINAVIQGVSKLGMAVRGIFGEGSENLGNLYQVSNQSTLGEKEEQIVDRLSSVIKQIINHEKNARQRLLENRQNFLLDHVGRAYGILRHAYTISSQETLNSLSALRMGVDLGMFSSVDIHTVNELFIIVQPAHLQKYAGKNIDSNERDVLRASIVRERLKNVNNQ